MEFPLRWHAGKAEEDRMGEAADSLIGVIFLLGDVVRSCLARGSESNDLAEVRRFLKEADDAMSMILQRAKDAQAEIDGT